MKRKTNRNLDKEGPNVARREPARVGGDGGEHERERQPTNPTTPIVVTSSGRLLCGFLNGYSNPPFSRFRTGSGSRSMSVAIREGHSSSAKEGVAGHTIAGARLTSNGAERASMGGKRFTLWRDLERKAEDERECSGTLQ
jgi:hypothetical protein